MPAHPVQPVLGNTAPQRPQVVAVVIGLHPGPLHQVPLPRKAPEGRGPLSKRKFVPEIHIQEFLEREIAKSHPKAKQVRRSKDLESLFIRCKRPKYRGLVVRRELSQGQAVVRRP